jgi:hypothetical protein
MSYTKAQLIELNNDSKYGYTDWIKNIDKINNNELVNIYPTGEILSSGRIYIALPSNIVLTSELKKKYNLI